MNLFGNLLQKKGRKELTGYNKLGASGNTFDKLFCYGLDNHRLNGSSISPCSFLKFVRIFKTRDSSLIPPPAGM
jgi:hypothetical protein